MCQKQIGYQIKKNGKTATLELKGCPNMWFYNVWSPKKGFVATGWRKTEQEALKAIQVILAAKGV
jgi:hypothetical protein